MRIKGFSYYLQEHMRPHELNNSTVVIDAQNIFFKTYKNWNIPFALGSESDRYARRLREYIGKFKKANVKCHFVIKGGHENKEMLNVYFTASSRLHGRDFIAGKKYDDIVKPLFVKDIWMQVLDEMGLHYVVCNEDSTTECIVLAKKLACPIISFNVEYFFSHVQYIPEPSIVLDEHDNLRCEVVTLSTVMNKLNLTYEKIILFIMLTDQYIFDESVYMEFFKRRRIPFARNRLDGVFRWLAEHSEAVALKIIFKSLSKSERVTFLEKKAMVEKLMSRRQTVESTTVLYITDKQKAEFTQSDPDWFEKGVFFKYIAIPYINLFKYKIIQASNMIEDYDQENSIMLSLDIVKYAFDLLTNFEGLEITVEHKVSVSVDEKELSFTYRDSVRKPNYEAANCVFENGWDNIKQLKLFEHFFIETFQSFDFDRLNGLPSDSKLLLIALTYFSRKSLETQSEIYSIILCYVMLGVVCEKKHDGSNESVLKFSKPFHDSFVEKQSVTVADCNIAWSIMRGYFEIQEDEHYYIFDRKLMHPLVQFQRCLEEINYLNQLCGKPYDPTIYSKTYNGTFVYKVLYSMKDVDGFEYLQKKLNPAPTVLAFLTGIVEACKSLVYEY